MADVLGILGGAAEALQGISLPQVNQGNIYVEESLTPGPGACFPLDLPAFTGVLFRRFLPMLCRLVLASSSSSFHVFPFLCCLVPPHSSPFTSSMHLLPLSRHFFWSWPLPTDLALPSCPSVSLLNCFVVFPLNHLSSHSRLLLFFSLLMPYFSPLPPLLFL